MFRWVKAEREMLHPSILRGKLQHLNVVGRGTSAKVSLSLYGGMYVAVKELRDESRLREAKWECEVLAKLKHPNIVRLLGCDFSAPPIVVTRFIGDPNHERSLTIYECLRQKSFPHLVPFWIHILTQISDALLYLHVNARIVHNDLKTDNVVLEQSPVASSPNYSATIIDFGKAALIGINYATPALSSEQQKEHSRRFPHVAPELWKGVNPTPASDMFSFGHLMQVICTVLEDQSMACFYNRCKNINLESRPSAGSCLAYLNSYKYQCKS